MKRLLLLFCLAVSILAPALSQVPPTPITKKGQPTLPMYNGNKIKIDSILKQRGIKYPIRSLRIDDVLFSVCYSDSTLPGMSASFGNGDSIAYCPISATSMKLITFKDTVMVKSVQLGDNGFLKHAVLILKKPHDSKIRTLEASFVYDSAGHPTLFNINNLSKGKNLRYEFTWSNNDIKYVKVSLIDNGKKPETYESFYSYGPRLVSNNGLYHFSGVDEQMVLFLPFLYSGLLGKYSAHLPVYFTTRSSEKDGSNGSITYTWNKNQTISIIKEKGHTNHVRKFIYEY